MAESREIVYKLKVDADTGKLVAFSSSLEKTGTAASSAGKGVEGMTGSVLKAQLAFAALAKAWELATRFFEIGLHQFQENEQVLARVAVVAERTGVSFEAIQKAADSVINPLVEAHDKLASIADLLQRGFSLEQATAMTRAFGDIAASSKSAGETVAGAMQRMVDAFTKGRVAGSDLIKMLPSLKGVQDSLQKMVQGTDTAADRLRVFNAVMKDASATSGALDRYMQTSAGAMELLKLSVNNAAESFTRGFMEAIRGSIAEFVKFINENQNVIGGLEELGHVVGTVLVGAIKIVISSMMGLQNMAAIFAYFRQSAEMAFLGIETAVAKWAANTLRYLNEVGSRLGITLPGVGEAVQRLDGIVARNNNVLLLATNIHAKLADEIRTRSVKAEEMFGEAIEGTGTAVFNEIPAVDGLGKATDDLAGKTNKLVDAFNKELRPLDDLTKKIGELQKAGVGAESIMKVYADDILKAAEAMKKMNEPLTENEKALVAQANAFEDAQFAAHAYTTDFSKWVDQAKEAIGTTRDMTGEFAKIGSGTMISGIRNMIGSLTDLANQGMRTVEVLETTEEKLQRWANTIGTIGSLIGGGVGDAFQSVAVGLDSVSKRMKDGASTTEAWVGGIVDGFTAFARSVDGATGVVLRDIAAIAQGFIQGGWLGAAIAGIGVLASALGSLFQKDWGAEISKQMSALLPGITVSAELADKIAQMAKDLGDGATAIALNLTNIINETGIGMNNIGTYLSALHDTFSFLERGQIDASQATEILDQNFAKLAEAAAKYGGQYVGQVAQIIQLTRQFGIQSKAVTDYVNSQVSTIISETTKLTEGFSKKVASLWEVIQNGGNLTADQMKNLEANFSNLSEIVAQTFDEILKNGGSITDAFSQLDPLFSQLADAADKFGLSGNEAFQSLLSTYQTIQKFKPDLERLGSLANIYKSLAALGDVSVKEFNNLQSAIERTYSKMTAGSKDGKAALAAIAPELQLLQQLHEQFGYAIDSTTQALIDEAQKMGLLKSQDPTDALISGFSHLDSSVSNLTNAINTLSRALGAIPDNVDTTVTTHYETEGAPPPATSPPPTTLQGLRGVFTVPYNDYRVILHKGEKVVGTDVAPSIGLPSPVYRAPVGISGTGGRGEIHVHGDVILPGIRSIRDLYRDIEDAIKNREIRIEPK